MARPCRASSALSAESWVPALTRMSFDARLSVTRPARFDRSTMVPPVAAAGVNECPEPTGLTTPPSAAADLTTATTSSVLAGCATAEAVAC